MLEKDITRVIRDIFQHYGYWFYKIPDPQKSQVYSSSQRPFDAILISDYCVGFLEIKRVKGFKTFNLSQIRSHQISHLKKIDDLSFSENIFSHFLIVFWVSRKMLHMYIFDVQVINYLVENGVKSILKKELQKLPYVDLKKFKIDDYNESIITLPIYHKCLKGGDDVS